MYFTYDGYRHLIKLLKKHRYEFSSYFSDQKTSTKCVVFRHDIDNDIEKAIRLAEIEHEEKVFSTFFVLLTSDFYNVFSSRNATFLRTILSLGHEIGLHFDEVRYPGLSIDELRGKIIFEANLLSDAIGREVKVVSMHRPSKMVIDSDLKIPGIVNSYSQAFFKDYKYLSDSRRRWREPVEDIIESEKYEKLHILTHAFWYNEQERDIHESLKTYVNHANMDRYLFLRDNIADIESIMEIGEVICE